MLNSGQWEHESQEILIIFCWSTSSNEALWHQSFVQLFETNIKSHETLVQLVSYRIFMIQSQDLKKRRLSSLATILCLKCVILLLHFWLLSCMCLFHGKLWIFRNGLLLINHPFYFCIHVVNSLFVYPCSLLHSVAVWNCGQLGCSMPDMEQTENTLVAAVEWIDKVHPHYPLLRTIDLSIWVYVTWHRLLKS